MKFLGIDLGWQSGASGLCCLSWATDRLRLIDLQCQPNIPAVLTWVDQQGAGPLGAAVDAPTLIPNATGMRLPDRLAHRVYGRYHAGCYPANRGRPFAKGLIAFGEALQQRGLAHAPEIVPQQPGRFQIEVFPHPAMVRLFCLPRILKYKKGRLADRQRELGRLRELILTVLPRRSPPLLISADQLPAIPDRGIPLKAVEDQLDSVICAYAAAHYWYWGAARNQVLGNLAAGYIVVPCPDGVPE